MGKKKKKKAPESSTVHAALSVCAEAGFDALVGCMLFLANYYFLSFFGFLFFWPCSLLVWCACNVTFVQLTYLKLGTSEKHDAVGLAFRGTCLRLRCGRLHWPRTRKIAMSDSLQREC